MPVSIMVLTSSFALISIVVRHHLAITKKTLSTDFLKDVYDSFRNDNYQAVVKYKGYSLFGPSANAS